MVSKEGCAGCGACFNTCPMNCIKLVENNEGFIHPEVDDTVCSRCGKCDEVCPMEIRKDIPAKEKDFTISDFLFINGSEYDRGVSSSGGFVKAVSDIILEQEGNAVFGAKFNERFDIEHAAVTKKDDIYPLLGSKYVQSNTGTTFREAKDILDKGYKVLYVGTPCQIAGLKSYIGKKYESSLYTVSLFCHGVPSRVAWRSYLSDYWSEETIRYIQFRYKYTGWWNYGLRMQFLHDDYYSSCRSMADPYLKMFLNNVSLNKECYSCKFREPNMIKADFYIGDAWNINRIRTNMDDNKGITSVLCYTEKGREIVLRLKDKHKVFDISEEEILKFRGDFCEKAIPKTRKNFFDLLNTSGFKNAFSITECSEEK